MAEDDDFGFKLKEEFNTPQETKEETTDEVVEETKEDVVEEVTSETEEKEEVKAEDETSALEEKETTEEVVEDKAGETTTVEETAEATQEVETRSLNRDEISELTDGEFESAEDLMEAYTNLNTFDSSKNVMEQLNEQVSEEWGDDVSFQDLVAYKSVDYDEMDAFKLLANYEELKDSDISESEIRAELRPFDLLKKPESVIEQMIEDGDLERGDYEDLQARLTRKSRQAKNELKEFQNSINIDDFNIQSNPAEVEEQPTATDEELKAISDRYEASINSLPDLKVNVGTEDSPIDVDYAVSDDDRKSIREFLIPEEGKNFIQKHWLGEDGIFNMDKLSADIYKIQNHDRNVSIAYSQGKAAGGESEVKDISNIDFKDGQTKSTKGEGLSEAAKMARDIN